MLSLAASEDFEQGIAMSQILIDVPDEIRDATDFSTDELQLVAKEALIVRLYSLGKLSSGRAATLLDMSRREFLDLLGRCGVSFFDDSMDLAAEVDRAH